MKLFKSLFIVGIVILFYSFGYGQNQIDYINSYLWSGYLNPISDGDTLYINCLNGHGVERYYIGNLSNPVFIDKEAKLGFEIIDFSRRLMIESNGNNILLASFADFTNTQIISSIRFTSPVSMYGLRLLGNRLVVLSADSLRTYDISDLFNPNLRATIYFPAGYYYVLGTTVALSLKCHPSEPWLGSTLDYYDLTNPDHINFIRQDTINYGFENKRLYAANGDTMAIETRSFLGSYSLHFIQFFINREDSVIWETGSPQGDIAYKPSLNGFFMANASNETSQVFSYDTMRLLGIIQPFHNIWGIQFECAGDSILFYTEPTIIRIYGHALYPNPNMPILFNNQFEHYGTYSVYEYEKPYIHVKYLLVGMESNDGELSFYRIMQSGDLSYSGHLLGLKAKNIIFEGTTAICQCPLKLATVDLTNIGSTPGPTITHEFDINGEILDITKGDSLYYAITSSRYFVIRYDSTAGFSLVASLNFGSDNLTSLAHMDEYTYILKGNIGIIDIVRAESESNPILMSEYRLPAASYKNIHYVPNDHTFWVSGNFGTEILNLSNPQILAHIDSSQIKSANQLYLSNDTVFVTDDTAGLKVFIYSGYPHISLTSIGHYLTRNAVNHIAYHGNELYISDYFSLQHLRWGAHVDITDSNTLTLPQTIGLSPNYPNPFNSSTTLRYSLPVQSSATIDIYDILGRKMQTLDKGIKPAGNYQVIWQAQDIPSGVYFYKLTAGEFSQTRKMILMK